MVNTEVITSDYFSAGRASDLATTKDRLLYRFLELVPGIISWVTILGTVWMSFFRPTWAAIFIICFDLYWLLKTVYMSVHMRHNWRRLRYNMKLDWSARLVGMPHEHIMHLIVLPFYKESREVIDESVRSLLADNYDSKKMMVVLSAEERAGEEFFEIGRQVCEKYKNQFFDFVVAKHPANLSGEMPGKGSNIAFAAEVARREILDIHHIPYEDVIVSAFDIDTVAYPEYFACLTWHFLNHPRPHHASFQPVPLYNNNIWDAPAFSRVVAISSSFWQMIQQERPERLATFSSHAVSFKALYEIGYWQKNMVSEDSRIFWNLFLAHDGDYEVVPITYPVSMDANLADTFWQTMKNIYKQTRRWAWGVENLPYITFGCIKNKDIPLHKKITVVFNQLEGFWSLATNPLIIFILGWLPLWVGGIEFRTSVLSYNLPTVTAYLMNLAMLGLILSSVISFSLLPPAPEKHNKRHKRIIMYIQWIFVPITITIFSAIPGMDAQTRLLLGRYMGFWVTPKVRKS